MKKHPILFVIFLFLGADVQAQVYDAQYLASHPRIYTKRYSFWTEGDFSFDLSKDFRWQFQLDYQYRRCSNPSYIVGGSNNPFQDHFQTVYRPWLHYWLKPGQLRFSLSPFGYWFTWVNNDEAQIYPPTKESNGTYGTIVYPELRTSVQVMTVQKFGRLEFFNRFRYEYKLVGMRTLADNNLSDYSKGMNFHPAPVGDPTNDTAGISRTSRFRYQVRVQVPLSKSSKKNTLYVNAWAELFLSFGKYVATSKILNQERTIALIGYKWAGKVPIKLEVGLTEQISFLYNIKTPPTQPSTVNYNKQNVECNTAFQIYLIIDNMQNLFRKRSKE